MCSNATMVIILLVADSNSKRKGKSRQRKDGGGGKQLQFDFSELIFPHHKAMLSSLALIGGGKKWSDPAGTISILIVGLGGGALPMFIKKYLPMVSTTVL